MIQTILVPLDGSIFSEHALPAALEIARCAGARLRLLYVHSFSASTVYLEGGPYIDERLDSLARQQGQSYLEELKNSLVKTVGTNLQIESEWIDRSPQSLVSETIGGCLAQSIADSKADLVVMTTHGRSGWERLWLGSVAEEVVRKSETPILLLRPQSEIPNYQQVPSFKELLIPLDGSPEAAAILEPALELATLLGSKVTLLQVVTPFDAYPDIAITQAVQINEQACTQAEHYLEKIAHHIESQYKMQVAHRVFLHSETASSILHDAQECGNDWLALATHGRSGFKRFLLGSVAENVLRKTTLPVLLYRPKEVA